ncbi:MAG: hypothetical protein E5V25_01660 [Mesorhizobium sp.]|nr:MAG: hypothetical protein E5V25_01660 [Mesorhizobium sp.]
MPGQQNIRQIENELAKTLTSVLSKDQSQVAALMVEWWNRQIIHAHCGKRDKAIPRFELVKRHMEIVADIEHDTLVDYFAVELPPDTTTVWPRNGATATLTFATSATDSLKRRSSRRDARY